MSSKDVKCATGALVTQEALEETAREKMREARKELEKAKQKIFVEFRNSVIQLYRKDASAVASSMKPASSKELIDSLYEARGDLKESCEKCGEKGCVPLSALVVLQEMKNRATLSVVTLREGQFLKKEKVETALKEGELKKVTRGCSWQLE